MFYLTRVETLFYQNLIKSVCCRNFNKDVNCPLKWWKQVDETTDKFHCSSLHSPKWPMRGSFVERWCRRQNSALDPISYHFPVLPSPKRKVRLELWNRNICAAPRLRSRGKASPVPCRTRSRAVRVSAVSVEAALRPQHHRRGSQVLPASPLPGSLKPLLHLPDRLNHFVESWLLLLLR